MSGAGTNKAIVCREALELLIQSRDNDHEAPFQALTFILATIYELCTKRIREKTIAIAARHAVRALRED
jgi:hypothetical protein